ncbi:MAG: hypothetical protein MRZ09_05315 [Coprobacillus sp.]|nr:hypothetical protein [Coprobacillus sp.]
MKVYREFHGEIRKENIGKVLRSIVKTEKDNFKILTGYGSSGVVSFSKLQTIKALKKMQKEGLIKGYLPGEVKNTLVTETSDLYENKNNFSKIIKDDPDYGNDGIIFIFVK